MVCQKNTKRTIWLVASLFLFSIAAPLYAAERECNKQMSNKEKTLKQQETSQATEKRALLCDVRDLIGSDVRSRASVAMAAEHKMGTMGSADKKAAEKRETKHHAEKIGTVKELIFDNSRARVDCVVVASQGKYYPVPWWAFNVRNARFYSSSGGYIEDPAVAGRYGQGWLSSGMWTGGSTVAARRPALFLNITRDQLRQAPTIASVSLERLSDPQLNQAVYAFYSQHVRMERGRWERGEMQAAASSSSREGAMKEEARPHEMIAGSPLPVKQADLALASMVVGLKVQDPQYAEVHRIQNVLIDARGGNLAYGLVSFGGFLGIGDKTAAVPWSVLSVRVPEGFARLDASRQTLEAAAIRDRDLARLAEHQYARQIYRDFGVEPYWQVFGFVPGEEMKASVSPWLPDSTYNKSFDPSKVTTVEGTIESVGTFYPETGAIPGTSLEVKAKDGALMTVYAGPRAFAAQESIGLKSGQAITVTGCKTTLNGKPVIMAGEIRVDGKTLRLRDSQGKPEWKIEDLQPGK